MAARRFTPTYALLVAAWCAQAAFAFGLVVARAPAWPELAALFGVMAVAPLAPEPVIPWLVPIPLVALLAAAAREPALWG